jgi:hypothetical protein
MSPHARPNSVFDSTPVDRFRGNSDMLLRDTATAYEATVSANPSTTGRAPSSSSRVERAAHAGGTEVEDVRVDHRRRDVAVSEKLLDGPDVLSALEEVRGKGVPEGMTGDAFGHAGFNRARHAV